MPVKEKKKIFLKAIKTWCKKCGICASICPKQVIEYDEEGYPVFAHLDKCIFCGQCWTHCPDYAIVEQEELYNQLLKEFNINE